MADKTEDIEIDAEIDRWLTQTPQKDFGNEDGHFYFVYGSLRQGMYNAYMLGDSRFVKKAILRGYKLVSMGSYPAIHETGNKDDIVEGEVYEINDFNIREQINTMEIMAGYNVVMANVNGSDSIKVIVFVVAKEYCKGRPIIEHGDWVRFMEERRGQNEKKKTLY